MGSQCLRKWMPIVGSLLKLKLLEQPFISVIVSALSVCSRLLLWNDCFRLFICSVLTERKDSRSFATWNWCSNNLIRLKHFLQKACYQNPSHESYHCPQNGQPQWSRLDSRQRTKVSLVDALKVHLSTSHSCQRPHSSPHQKQQLPC